MPKRRVVVSETVMQLYQVITFLFKRHQAAWEMLMGEHNWPDAQSYYDLLDRGAEANTPVQGGGALPEAQRLIEACSRFESVVSAVGGRDAIVSRFRSFRKEYPDLAEFLKDAWGVGKNKSSFRRLTLEGVAMKHNVSIASLYRQRSQILLGICSDIVYVSD